VELNVCSQRQQKEAQEGAEQNLAQRYVIFYFLHVLLVIFLRKKED
jgi:hypothetical protein